MSEIVNLNKARKARERTQARTRADANAARFGRTKAQKAREEAEAKRASAELDGKRRDPEAD